MTQSGYDALVGELNSLKINERPATVVALDEARQLGDLKENAEYHAAKEKLSLIDIRISELNDIISRSIIVDPSTLTHNKVSFGSTVKLIDLDDDSVYEYTIVGTYESNPACGMISFHSPLAKQLLGKQVSDEVRVILPSNDKHYEIEEIFYKPFEVHK